ncbi:YgaP family membrane protein [Rossellomorea aquimaris]|uniref:YgaP family membrane protein n=1 Tax=Rossellomorea aquimaris TaxID=189382 RepID=UPI0007D041FC|nr:DUF2892 domain-containing protein [Rossellomorea aquimaris]
MKSNVGSVDKVIRIILGIILLSLLFFIEGSLKWIGLFGGVLLLTAFINWCPLYLPFGISTCRRG